MPDSPSRRYAAGMRTPQEHLTALLAGLEPLPPVDLPLIVARDCVLAEDVHARWPLPSFANSAMDGYAVRAADVVAATADRPVRLEVIEDIPAGAWPQRQLLPGTAARIMTGAPVPEGADGIVRVEHTDGGMPVVEVCGPAGDDIRRIGEDVADGVVVLTRGALMNPRTIGLAAAVGRDTVRVHPRPLVHLISTGSELVEPGQLPEPGQISDVNGVMLEAALLELGVQVTRSSIVHDDAEVLTQALLQAADASDLVITTGGVSMGAYDTVKAVLTELGSVRFERVAMQPGMPQGWGRIGITATPIITLPGNPVSALVSLEVFVRPALRLLQGRPSGWVTSGSLRAGNAFTSPPGKMQFVRARRETGDDGTALTVGAQGSHILGGLAQADCLLIVPAHTERVATGDTLEFLDLRKDAR